MDVGRDGNASLASPRLLRRHVRRRPEHGAALGQRAISLDSPGQPEIGNQRLALVVDQDIGWFQVAVQDAPFVGMGDSAGDDRHQLSGCSRRTLIFREPFRQVSSFDQLHAEKAATAFLANRVDRHDIGMVEIRKRLGLILESPRIVLGAPRWSGST